MRIAVTHCSTRQGARRTDIAAAAVNRQLTFHLDGQVFAQCSAPAYHRSRSPRRCRCPSGRWDTPEMIAVSCSNTKPARQGAARPLHRAASPPCRGQSKRECHPIRDRQIEVSVIVNELLCLMGPCCTLTAIKRRHRVLHAVGDVVVGPIRAVISRRITPAVGPLEIETRVPLHQWC
jgi:hypothetical protein